MGLDVQLAPMLALASSPGEMGHLMTRLVLQLGVILVAARLGGILVQRLCKGPMVLGELAAGMLIGPYALGAIPLGAWGPLFPLPAGTIPISPQLYGIATLAAILLLFLSGLETDLAAFLRYSMAGMVVGLGGLVVSFLAGNLATVWCGFAESMLDPPALFLGAIATATSVGLTARLLSEKRQMGSPEGVTILAAAIFDDVLGIVLVAVVAGMTRALAQGGTLEWQSIALLAAKAIGFWLLFSAAGLLLARRFTQLLKRFRSRETMVALTLGLALLIAGLSEMAGLAMIIGAYIAGLALSRTDLANELQDQLRNMYRYLIPVFFCVMGMLVNVPAMRGALLFGLVYAALAILSKLAGCGLPALLLGFTGRGALRIGAGMVPRAEVCLIVAGIGLSTGALTAELFGVAIMMAALSTLSAPPMLIRAFQGGSGIKNGDRRREESSIEQVSLSFPSESIAEFLQSRIVQAFRDEEFFVHRLHTDSPTFQIRKEDMSFTLVRHEGELALNVPREYHYMARLIVLEELLELQELLDQVRNMQSPGELGSSLLQGMFCDDGPDNRA